MGSQLDGVYSTIGCSHCEAKPRQNSVKNIKSTGQLLSGRQRDADLLDGHRGLFWCRPALALAFTAMLLSLAAIPLTAGFLGKFYIVAAGASVEAWALILILVTTSTMGLFYYQRLVVVLYHISNQAPRLIGITKAIHGGSHRSL